MKRLLLPFLLCGCELIVHFDPPPEEGEQCTDKLDNDLDGKFDCADDGCADFCRCGNGIVYPPAPSLAAPLLGTLPGAPSAVAAGDIDGDGTPDLVFALRGGQVVVRAAVTGLPVGTPVNVPGTLVALALGDLDGNGTLDALVVDQAGGQVYPLLNVRGSFTVGTPVVAVPAATAIVLADFDGDGDLDAAIVGDGTQPSLVTLVNDAGTFRLRQSLPAEAGASSIAAADLDGDGAVDLIVGASADVIPYRNADSGFFQAGTPVSVGQPVSALAVVDVNGDRRPDLVLASASAGSLGVLRNDGQGTLGAGTSVAVPNATALAGVAAGDMNHDGNADVVLAAEKRLVIMTGNGGGGFLPGAEVTASTNVLNPIILFADGDGRPDVAAVTIQLNFVLALGDGEECDSPDRTMCLADCTFPGKAVWARAGGGVQDDAATDVAVDAADNVYVVGTFRGQLSIGGAPALASQGGSDFFVASFKPDGTLRWRAAFGGKLDDTAEGVAALRFGSIVVVGQSGPASYGSAGQIGPDKQAYALVLSAADGTPQFLSTFTDDASSGSALAVTLDASGSAIVGGRFDGRLNAAGTVVSGPGGFLADLSSGLIIGTFTGDAADAVVRVRAADDGVAALLSFAGTVPELSLTSEGARDLAVLRYGAGNEFLRADVIGGGGDAVAGDIAACPPSLLLFTGFGGALRVGQTTFTAQGGSDAALVRFIGGTTSVQSQMTAAAEVATAVVCDARGNVVVGGSLSLLGSPAAIGSFAADGMARWGLPGGFAPARFARDSVGDIYAAGSFSAAFVWGADNLTPAGGSDGVLVKLRP